MSDPEIVALRALLAQYPAPTELGELRKLIDSFATLYAVAPDVTIEPVSAGGIPAEWSTTPNADASRVILYLHGGGYVIGSLNSHRHLVTEIGRAAGTRVLALDYRLAPEHPFPAAVEDALAGYRFLLAGGVAPGNIAIAGDSAGGGLTVAAMLAIRDAGLPQPACGWTLSPWVDMEAIGDSMTNKSAEDPSLQKPALLQMATWYLNNADPRSPLAAPIYADLHGLAPLLIQVGAAETLLDDSVRLARVAGAADVAVTLEIWPEMIHVWHHFHPQLAAGRRAIAAGGEYVHKAIDASA
jgi:monoterpene epsilon-lactone hydrolase